MVEDFYTLYNTYSNIQLLRIIENPEDYQPKAVLTASEILSGRNVTAEEHEAVRQETESLLFEKRRKAKERIKIEEFIRRKFLPYPENSSEVNLEKWVNILCLVQSILYVVGLKEGIEMAVAGYTFGDVFWGTIYLIPVIATPVLIFLLIKRKKWGWIIFQFCIVIGVLFSLSSIYFYIRRYIKYGPPDTWALEWLSPSSIDIITPLVTIAMAIFLCKKKVRAFFNITLQTMYTTIGLAIGFVIFIQAITLLT